MKNKDLLHYDPISRRVFIRSVCGGLVAFPFLESVLGEKAYASAIGEKRFIGITTPNQLPYAYLGPSKLLGANIPTNYQSVVSQLVDPNGWNYRRVALSDVILREGRISDLLDNKFNAFSNSIYMYRGLDFPGRIDHGRATSLGNMAASHLGHDVKAIANMTIDEFMANSLNFYPNGRFSMTKDILRLGENSISTSNITGNSGVGIGANNGGLSYNGNLSLALQNWFSTASTQSNSSKKNIVDRIISSINTLKSRNSMGAADVIKVEEHQDRLSQLSSRLASTSTVNMSLFNGVTMPNITPSSLGNLADGPTQINNYYTNLVLLLSLAIKCGITKIATIGVESSILSTGASSAQGGSPGSWHGDYAHGNIGPEILALNKWVIDNVVYKLALELNSNESTGVKYLDNTCIYFTPENSYGHSGEGMAGFTIGGSSRINSGNYFDYGDYARRTVKLDWLKVTPDIGLEHGVGLPINRLHVSLLRAMGLTSQDYINKFGNSGSGFGFWRRTYNDSWEANMGSVDRANPDLPLPGFLKS